MKLKAFVTTVLLTFVFLASGLSAKLTIIAEGKSDYIIAVSGQSQDSAKITEAAKLLQHTIVKSLGVSLPVVNESEVSGRPAIFLGKTTAARRAGIPLEDITGWDYRIRVVGSNVYLEREYMAASFGKAVEPMSAFFTTMHRRMEARQLLDRHETGNPDRRYRGYPFEMYPDDYLCHFFPPQVLQEMDRQLALAKQLVQSDEARARIELVEAEFRYLHCVASTYHLFRAYQVAPTQPLFDALEKQVTHYHQTYNWLYPKGQARYPGGYRKLRTPFSTGWPTGNQPLPKVPGPPFDWDFDRLNKTGELPLPILKPRIRGGQILNPFDKSTQPSANANSTINIDPETGAPEDQ